MPVAAASANWLKSPGRKITWPTGSALSDRIVEMACAYDTQAGALEVAARVAPFFTTPVVSEIVEVPGSRSDLFGRCVSLSGLPGVVGNAPVFVGEAEELGGVTRLTIYRRL